MRPERFGKCSPRWADINSNDLLGGIGLAHGLTKQTDGSTAKDDDSLVGSYAAHLGDLNGHCDGLDEGSFLHVHVVWNGITIVGLGDVVGGECAVVRWGRGEHTAVAKIVSTAATVVAAIVLSGVLSVGKAERAVYVLPAWHARFNGNPVAYLEVIDGGANLDHGTGALMAQNDWRVEDEV